ncbi:hypothetical protein C8T65DRAFT_781344 [Cerioporus squamosus]|nr:hypothetical protein C8T65DRAFT_781344 [Cerioporus squamosus]
MSSIEQVEIATDAAVASRAIVHPETNAHLTSQSDVLESTLFGQLAADKQHTSDTAENTHAWYRKYTDTLEAIGWVVEGAQFTEVHYDKTGGTVHDTVLEQLAKDPTVSKALYASVSRALLAFARAASDSDAEEVFDSHSVAESSEFASFQIAVASVDESGEVVLTLLAWFYSSNQKISNTLWFSWQNATLDIKTSTLTMTLNSRLYDQVRFMIHDKLYNAEKLDLIVSLC